MLSNICPNIVTYGQVWWRRLVGFKKNHKNCQKVVKKLSKSCQKAVKKFKFKTSGEDDDDDEEEGYWWLQDQVRLRRTW
jgi:hypothetical protein